MNKKIIIVFVCSSMLSTSAFSDNSTCMENRLKAIDKFDRIATDIYSKTIKEPDTDFLSKCIGQLRLPQFGFNFGIQDITKMIQNKICSMAREATSSAMNSISGSTYSFSGGQEMLDKFGMSKSTSGSVSYQTPSTVSSASSAITGNGITGNANANNANTNNTNSGNTSNSTYLNNSINSAINFLTR